MVLDVEKLRNQARTIAREQFVPLESKERPARVNRPLIRALGDSDLLPRLYLEEFGGSASSSDDYASTLCALREGIAMESTEASMCLAVQAGASSPLIQSGNRELIDRWVPRIARGEAVPAFALTEPGAGSDAGQLTLRAEVVPGGWRLTGEKLWITNAPDADIYTVFARTTDGAGPRGVTAFLIPANTQGLSGEPLDLLKSHAVGRLSLDGVFVSPDEVLGGVDVGFKSAMVTLDAARSAVGAAALGAGFAAIELAIDRAITRTAFGKRLGDFQAVSHPIAQSLAELTAARLLIYESARAYDTRRTDVSQLSAMGKLFATEAATSAVDHAMQVFGTQSLETSHRLTQLYHEVRACRFEDGTQEITREVIARDVIGRPTPERVEGDRT